MVGGPTSRAILSIVAAMSFLGLGSLGVGAQDATGVDQIALYTEQQQEVTRQGQEFIQWFLDGDDVAFLDRSSPRVQEALADTSFDVMLQQLQTNRISMDYPAGESHFRGYFDVDGRISGFYHDGTSRSFRLTADEPQEAAGPTGRWTGFLYPDEAPINVTFSGPAEQLTATIDLPAQGVEGAALANVSFAAQQPIGEVVNFQSLPLSPTSRPYTEVRAWGDGYIVFNLSLDSSGTIQRFRFTTPWQTPPDSDLQHEDVAYTLPASEQLFAYWGGQNELPSYHAGAPGWRYGYDFAIWRDGATFGNSGGANEDYYIWGMPVVAPASGTVVAVESSMADLLPGESAQGLSVAEQAGNYVLLQTDANTWIVLAHLQQGSVSVNVGETVQAGDQIGLVGRSGRAPEPMLHVHAQSSPELDSPAGTGVPMFFTNVVVGGVETPELATLHRGQFVAPVG